MVDDPSLQDEATLVADINSLRQGRGLVPLVVDSRLTEIGRWWAKQMAAAGSLSHNPSLATQAPPEWRALGENVGSGPGIGDVFNGFTGSPEHLANMLNPAFDAVGVGVAYAGVVWASVEFMQAPPASIVADHLAGSDWYRIAGAGGDVISFGAASGVVRPPGSTGAVVGLANTPTSAGYWLVARDGGIFAFGDAKFFGSTGSLHLSQPIVGMAATPTGAGYWLVAKDGGIFAFGDAKFFGSTGSVHLSQPIVGMAASPTGAGYWLVAQDGGIFAFGDAKFFGSTGSVHLSQPIVGMAATPTGGGYWLVARDGGIFAFGDAKFLGSTGSVHLSQPIVGMAASPTGAGYWLVAQDGGIFAFGDAAFLGSLAGHALPRPVVGIIGGA
jgi:predicted type IV restriction endonuclease